MTDTTEPQPQAERWRFAGRRRSAKDGTPLAAWEPKPGGRLLYYTAKGAAGLVTGGEYEVQVSREGDDHTYMHGTPRFLGRTSDTELATAWEAAEHIALRRIADDKRQRQAKKQTALDEALEPLMRIASAYRSRADQDALAAYVIGQLHSAWTLGPGERAR